MSPRAALTAVREREAAHQFAKFAVVGLTNTGVSFAFYAPLVLLGVHYLSASVLAFGLGTLNSYTLNRTWTFRAGAFSTGGLARYLCVQGAALGLNAALLVLLVEALHVDRLVAQAVALPIVSASTFTATRAWVFPRGLAIGD
jgi:putative flippase GtrA